MKRLRELDASSALLDRAKALVLSVDAMPESQERLLRVRRELDVPRGPWAFARGLPALSGAGLLLMFGASVFAAVRLFAPADSRSAPPSAAPIAERSGLAAGAGGPSATPSNVAPLIAELAGVQVHSARSASARERHARHHVRSGHATQLSARVSSRAHAARSHTVAAPAPSTAWQSSSASSEAELALSPADATPRMDAQSASASNASLSVSANAESSSDSMPKASAPAKAEPQAHEVARAADRAVSQPQPSAAEYAPAAQPIDSELVHRAFKALRHDHDPALAAHLLDQQRAAVHGGPLAEEALALQIEATALLQQVRSRDFAREYLARYPNGRYRSVAEKALQDLRP